ncbi:hypothetical protein P4204_12095 [Pseudomonas aeruginosa]|nr:hypothetical protein [Pseudomonas aeruginosa]
MGIIEVNGFFNDRGEALDLSVGGDPQRDRGLFLTDLSSLYYDKASDHLLWCFRRVAGGHRTGSRRGSAR